MKKMMVCDFGDILDVGVGLGYFYNKAHDIMVDANRYEGNMDKEDCEDLAEDYPDAAKILKAFFEKYNLEEVYVKPKGG